MCKYSGGSNFIFSLSLYDESCNVAERDAITRGSVKLRRESRRMIMILEDPSKDFPVFVVLPVDGILISLGNANVISKSKRTRVSFTG